MQVISRIMFIKGVVDVASGRDDVEDPGTDKLN